MNVWAKLAITVAGYAILLAYSAPVNATVTFCGPETEGMGCEGVSESKVFLDHKANTITGIGDVGSPGSGITMVIDSLAGPLNQRVDFSGGFATIDPANIPHVGKQIDFNGLSFAIPGFTFSDIVFDVQLTPTANPLDSFSATAFGPGMTVLGGPHAFFDAADTDKQFGLTSTVGMTQVNIASLTGLDEVKHIEVSGLLAIPEPRTWAMMLIGFGLMTLIGVRRRFAV